MVLFILDARAVIWSRDGCADIVDLDFLEGERLIDLELSKTRGGVARLPAAEQELLQLRSERTTCDLFILNGSGEPVCGGRASQCDRSELRREKSITMERTTTR